MHSLINRSDTLFLLIPSMNPDALLPWIRSFDGVTEENCPNFESLREGHVLASIFNQLTDDPQIDLTKLDPIDRTKDIWFSCLKNLRAIVNVIQKPFEDAKLTNPIDVRSISKNAKPEALYNLVSMFILYSLKGPKQKDMISRLKSMPKPTQDAVKDILKAQKSAAQSSPNRTAPSTSQTPQITPTTPSASTSTTQNLELKTQKIRLELNLKRLEKEKDQLLSENSDLKQEKEKLLAMKSNQTAGTSSSLSQIQEVTAMIREAEASRQKENEEIEQLDKEISALEPFEEQKAKLQAELDANNSKLRLLRQKISQSAPTIDSFRALDDEKARALLLEIDQCEKELQPEYAQTLKSEINEIKKKLVAYAEDVTEKIQLLGGPQLAEEGKTTNEDNETDITSQLSNEIDELTDRNNALNEEIIEIMAKAESIERMRDHQSFLEHIRSSSIFLKPE